MKVSSLRKARIEPTGVLVFIRPNCLGWESGKEPKAGRYAIEIPVNPDSDFHF